MHGISRFRSTGFSTVRSTRDGRISTDPESTGGEVMAFAVCLSLAGWLPIAGGIAVMIGAPVVAVTLGLLGAFFVGLTVWLYRQAPDLAFEPEPHETDLGFGRFGRR